MDVLDSLLDPLGSGIDRRALLEVIMLGGVCGSLSFWVIAFRLSYPAESLAHGLLPGLVLAALAGVPLLIGAVGGVGVAAVAVALAARDERIGSDTSTAVVVSGMFGLGALLALAPTTPARLGELLFGDPLGVVDSDLIAAASLLALGGAALFALHRPLSAVAFDPIGARAMGISPSVLSLALLGILAASLAVAVQGLGSLLVLAILIAPAAAIGGRPASPGRPALLAGATAACAGIVGIYASALLGSAAGASVALALCAAPAVSATVGGLRRAQAVVGRGVARP